MMKTMGIGYLTADPILQETDNTVFTTFTVAIHEFKKDKTGGGDDKQITHFIDCIAWDSGARTFSNLCKKGDRVFIVAAPRQSKWVDKDTGKNRSRIIFRVEEFRLISKKQQNKEEDEQPSE